TVGVDGVNNLVGTGGSISASSWTFIAATYDGANVRLYKNGVQDLGALTVALNTQAGSLNIGRLNATSPVCCFKGSIDEIVVSSKALNAADLLVLTQRGVSGRPYYGNKFLSTALSTNTQYGVQVEAYVPNGSGAFTAVTNAYTLAAIPGTPA